MKAQADLFAVRFAKQSSTFWTESYPPSSCQNSEVCHLLAYFWFPTGSIRTLPCKNIHIIQDANQSRFQATMTHNPPEDSSRRLSSRRSAGKSELADKRQERLWQGEEVIFFYFDFFFFNSQTYEIYISKQVCQGSRPRNDQIVLQQLVLRHIQLKGTENKLYNLENNVGLLSVFYQSLSLSLYVCVRACACMSACVPSGNCLKRNILQNHPNLRLHMCSSVTQWKHWCGSKAFCTQTWARGHQATLSNYTAGAWPFKARQHSSDTHSPPLLMKTCLSSMGLCAVCKAPPFASAIDGKLPLRLVARNTSIVFGSSGLNQRTSWFVKRFVQEKGEISTAKMSMSSSKTVESHVC